MSDDLNETITVLKGLQYEHAKKAAEIWGDATGGVHGHTAKHLEIAIRMIEHHGSAFEALAELEKFDFASAGYGHLIGKDPDTESPEFHATFTTVTRVVQIVQRIAKRGLRGAR